MTRRGRFGGLGRLACGRVESEMRWMQSAAARFFSCFLFSPSLSLFPQNTISLGVVMKAAVELMIRRREGVVGLGRREGGG